MRVFLTFSNKMFSSFIITSFLVLIVVPKDTTQIKGHRDSLKERIVKTECKYVFAQMNKIYRNTVSQDSPVAYTFFLERKYIQSSHVSQRDSLQTTNLRLQVGASNNVSLQYPIMFAVRQQKIISTLEVPHKREGRKANRKTSTSHNKQPKDVYYNAARTLCIENMGSVDGFGRNITVRVSTQSWKSVSFYIELKLTEDFQIPIGKEVTFDVSPSSSRYFGFAFARPDMKRVKIRVTSPTSDCMTISVQPPHCPIYDLEFNVRYQGLWQTMSTTAAMTVQKLEWYAEGFVLVFVAHSDKNVCGRKDILSSNSAGKKVGSSGGGGYLFLSPSNTGDPPSKRITLLLTDESKVSQWIIWLCLMIPIIATLLTALAVLCLFRNRHEWMVEILNEKFKNNVTEFPALINNPNNNDSSQSPRNTDHSLIAEMLLNEIMADSGSSINSIRRNKRRSRPISEGNITEAQPNASNRSVWKSDLVIADFNCKQYHEVKKFSKRFYWTIGIVAIFYSIPVYQLVFHYLRVLYRTGEYDICYYNYLCAQRLGLLVDFNHFWSNASYVIFGILYISIVRRRSRNLCLPQHNKHGGHHQDGDQAEEDGGCCCCSSSRSDSPGKVVGFCCCRFSKVCFRWDHGVPPHFGVFYALGVALTMEGFLSAAYHLCPNQSTFQFDTCFMYVIAVLLLLKIYQFRHPVHFGANHTFAILAFFVLASVVGLIFEQGTEKAILYFKCVFLPIQYILMIILCIYYYAVGYVRSDDGEIITDLRIYRYLGQLKTQRFNGDRLILPFISFSICIAVLVYSELGKIGFASYLLYLLVGNVLGTTLYYVGIMKPLHGEFKNRTWVQPVIYFLAAGVIGGFSLQYFVRAPAQWELSASASRAQNEECLTGWFPFHPFYDSHDAWHFLSAAALFLAFMGLLIVDDDLITTPQTKIPVF